jgi:Phosphotransferase enzyme family
MQTSEQLAIQASSEVAIAHGLQFQQAIVLQNLSNVILHLSPMNVVARVSTMMATQRQGDGWFAREVAVADYLTQVGAPIVPTSRVIAPGPHSHLGLVLSFWEWVQVLESPPDALEIGRSLSICHQALKYFSGDLSVLALLSEAGEILERLIVQDLIDSADCLMLRSVSARSMSTLMQFPLQPIHGDAHFGNVLNTSSGVLWTDWEDVFLGPIEWDLASLVANAWVFGTDVERSEMALRGYGRYDAAALSACVEARTLVALVWSIVMNQANPSPERRFRIDRRLDWLREQTAV